jgi:site-specific DNA-methyltransferase (adenine-specific)
MSKSLRLRLWDFLKEKKTLMEIYEAFEEKDSTIRGRLNENIGVCFKRLGRGIYIATDGDVQAIIINGDTWEVLDDLEESSIDCIIMDSPYGVLDQQMSWGTTRKRNLNGGWKFATKDLDEAIYGKLLRILKPGGHMFSFMPSSKRDTHEYIENQIQLAKKSGWTFNSQWIWDKKMMGMGYNGRSRHELIHFFSKGKRRLHGKGHAMRRTPDVQAHSREHWRWAIHETQKPIELIAAIIEFSTLPNEVVLDPFGGSCSTAAAALQTGRNSICIEIDRAMVRKACALTEHGKF